jgi:hypothetical protein
MINVTIPAIIFNYYICITLFTFSFTLFRLTKFVHVIATISLTYTFACFNGSAAFLFLVCCNCFFLVGLHFAALCLTVAHHSINYFLTSSISHIASTGGSKLSSILAAASAPPCTTAFAPSPPVCVLFALQNSSNLPSIAVA